MTKVLIGICVLSLLAACSGGDSLVPMSGPSSGSSGGGSSGGGSSGGGSSGGGSSGGASAGAASSGSASGSVATSGVGATGGAGTGSAAGSSASGTNNGSASSGDGGAGQLPCDINQFLQATCQSCHSSPPIGGAPMPLVTYADLTAPAVSDPAQTVAQMCVSRMQNTSRPMPPTGLTAATMTAATSMQSWITAGYQAGTCGAAAGSDAGATSPDPYATPVTCTSGKTYSGGNDGTSVMNPGQACISCHSSSGGPSFVIGGTVYPTAHEPNDCDGVNGSTDGATVVITDSTGATFTLNVNSAGNFYESRSTTIVMPFQAKVVQGGKERAMATPQSTGDCNACHTEAGTNNAPGRIMLP